MTARAGLIVAVILGFAIGGASALALRHSERSGRPALPAAEPGEARIGGSFTLKDVDGREVTERSFLGRPLLVVFGTTAPGDPSAAILTAIDRLAQAGGLPEDKISVAFIGLDPVRDSRDAVRGLIAPNHANIVGLVGTEEQLQHISRIFKIGRRITDTSIGDYSIDYFPIVFLLDSRGKYISHARLPSKVEQLKSLLSLVL